MTIANIAPLAKIFSVGLTGGIGSGKTTIADLFAARGATVIDTDHIAHRLTVSDGAAIPAIRAVFGDGFFTHDGELDRAKMREYIFTDPSAKKCLESILHPLIRTETEHAAAQTKGDYLIIVIPLLIESGTWKQRLSRVLVVDCPEQQQIIRVMHRSRLTTKEVHAIMATQASRQERQDIADDIIVNEGDPDALLPQIDQLHALYKFLAAEKKHG